MNSLSLLIAQGFGVGRLPVAPGTFGSLVGLFWVVLLTASGSLGLYAAGTIFGLGLSVWLCGVAEKRLNQTDPPSVVLDEIAALPVCFAPWVGTAWFSHHALPSPADFFTADNVVFTLILFVLFRVLDAAKPWPIRPIQRLPGGLGVTADDVLAALLVALVSFAFVGKITVS